MAGPTAGLPAQIEIAHLRLDVVDLEPHGAAKIDEAYRAHAAIAAGRAGFDLSDQHMAILIESTPYALALADRVPRQFSYTYEMAPVFSLPGWPHPR